VDKEHLKGAGQQVKGAIKDAAGGLTGDAKLQAEGKADKIEGKAREKLGDVKDAVRDATRR
jgi:uncharacterized protein YjbJ (UPF0337 family)